MNCETPLNMTAAYQSPYKLLWECADGSESDYSGEVQLTLEKDAYSLLLVVMRYKVSSYGNNDSHLLINDSSVSHKYMVNTSHPAIGMYYRTVEVTSTGLTFGPTYNYCDITTSNTVCYPYRIYGIY